MVSQLPAEVVALIMKCIKDECNNEVDSDFPEDLFSALELCAQSTLASCARVCRLWHGLAKGILYQKLCIDNSQQLYALSTTLGENRDLAQSTACLKVRLEPSHASVPHREVDILDYTLYLLPNLRKYTVDTRSAPRLLCSGIIPTEEHNPKLQHLSLLIADDRHGHDSFKFPLKHVLPHSIETLTLSGMGIKESPQHDLPNLKRLAMERLALSEFYPWELSGCRNLNHLVLQDPKDSKMGWVLRHFGKQIKTLELYFDKAPEGMDPDDPEDDEGDEDDNGPVNIDQSFERSLPILQQLIIRGNFQADEFEHLPKSLEILRWHGATDANVISIFLRQLCDASFLPNLKEFPTIYMQEEARYRYPGVRKALLRQAKEALYARGINLPVDPGEPAWNEKLIFPRTRSHETELEQQ